MIKLPDTEDLQDRIRVTERVGPGPRLRAAREASGFEIEEIAKQLRLHPHIIADLERDKFSDHLALVFVRGYLRSYAGLIGLDPEQVVEEFNAMGHKEDRDLPDLKGKPQAKTRMRNEADMNKAPISPGMKWSAIVSLVVAVGVVFIAYTREPEVQLNSVPSPISNSTEFDPTAAEAAVAEEPITSVAGQPATSMPAGAPASTATRPASTSPAAAPGAASQVQPAVVATPEPEAPPAPAPKPTYHDDDYDDGSDAMYEPELPKPGRSSRS
jgi:cytoskeleton protein RodZ